MAGIDVITNSHLFAHLYLPHGTNESMKFAACCVAAYVFFRGLGVIINNACCRIELVVRPSSMSWPKMRRVERLDRTCNIEGPRQLVR